MIFAGDRIKHLRSINNMSQTRLAEKMGVSKQAVSKWENNLSYPELLVLPGLAKIFKVDMSYFFKELEDDIKDVIPYSEYNALLKHKEELVKTFNEENDNIKLTIRKSVDYAEICLGEIKVIDNKITLPSILESVNSLSLPKLDKLKVVSYCRLKKVDSMFKDLDVDVLDLSEFNIAKIENLSGLFHGVKRIGKLIGLHRWDMSNVKSIKGLFRYANIGEIEGINEWDTSNIEDFTQVFYNATIDVLNISNWKLSSMITKDDSIECRIGQSSGLFQNANINTLDIFNDVSNVQRFIRWFANSKINSIDFSKWDISYGLNFTGMFNNCKTNNVDLTKWDIHQAVIKDNMFSRSTGIKYKK